MLPILSFLQLHQDHQSAMFSESKDSFHSRFLSSLLHSPRILHSRPSNVSRESAKSDPKEGQDGNYPEEEPNTARVWIRIRVRVQDNPNTDRPGRMASGSRVDKKRDPFEESMDTGHPMGAGPQENKAPVVRIHGNFACH
ncbi:hypothetical protein Lser_V15G07673 [Lactuca serriola]